MSSRRKNRRPNRGGDATPPSQRPGRIPKQATTPEGPVLDLTPAEGNQPQPLIFAALAAEYGGLDSPNGTDWGEPAMPPRGTARVMGTQ
ncbi:MAG TPA: hypothetical protein VF062_15765 [Candidatus Limnocylindrales bacterium]